MGQVLNSGPVSAATLTGLTPSRPFPLSSSRHPPTLHLEFILPEALRSAAEARTHCSQFLAALLETELAPGQRGRLLYHHPPGAVRAPCVLSIGRVHGSSRPTGTRGADRHCLITRMRQWGLAARLLTEAELTSTQRVRSTPAPRGATLLTLQCGPEATHPHITRALREALHHDDYVYILDFQRLSGRDLATQSASCLYALSLVLPGATRDAAERAQAALFEMNGALARRRTHRCPGGPFPTPGRLTHPGSMYTIADLIPA